jgi:hypothetical protein
MAYAILRTKKLKTPGNVSASASHIERTRPTHNADPSISNEWLIGGPGMYAAAKKTWEKIPKIRKDSVHAFEVLLTASPEAFEKMSLEEWKAENVEWLRKEYPGAEIVGACLHLDESTPHIQAIIVPTDLKKDGSLQLNCKKYLGGAAKLRSMQTSYAKAMAGFGLERGLEGSKAKHTTIAQFYGSISKGSGIKFKPFNVATPPAMLTGKAREAWANAQTAALKKDHAKPIQQLKGKAVQSIDLEKRNGELKRSNSALSADLSDAKRKLREQSDKLRQLPLTDVAERLGCYRPDNAKDKGLWMTPAGKVFIKDDVKFINHDQGENGGGAIDFVKHVKDCDFKEAVAWLGDMYGTDAAIEAAATAARLRAEEALKTAVAKPFALPDPVEKTWPRVREYLVKVRGLAESMIDKLKEVGWLYSDKRNNIVFVNANAHTNQICAYELKGTTDTPFKQAQGDSKHGIFLVEGGKEKLAVCESAVDAISYVQLHPQSSAIAVAGTGKYEAALPFIEKSRHLFSAFVCASDNDDAGKAMASNLNLPHEPPGRPGADWNDFLLDPTLEADRQAAPAERPQKAARRSRDDAPGLGI